MIDKIKTIASMMFSESSKVSMMRVMALLSLVSGIVLAFVGLNQQQEPSSLAVLVAVFVGSAFGGKALQKSQELKVKPKKVSNPDGK